MHPVRAPRLERMTLNQLTYTSVARPGLAYHELTAMLRTAVTYNASHSITGLLCYTGNSFLQVLEGHRSDVNRLYNRIVRDECHGACELLGYTDIVTRDFAEWTMKLVRCDGELTVQRRTLLQRHAAQFSLDPRAMTATQANAFLIELAQSERADNRVA